MLICPTCGAENPPTARYCGVCGNFIPPPAPQPAAQPLTAGTSIQARQPGRPTPAGPPPGSRAARGPSQDPGGRGSVAATVEPAEVHVEPGGVATAQVRIANLSRVVDEYRIDTLEEAGAWCAV